MPNLIGRSPNQVPVNGMLGTAAFVDIEQLKSGSGGAVITTNVTLTSVSPAAMAVIPSSPGLYVTLPNASNCNKASVLFSVYNEGDFDYGVKDSAGTQLGWIRPRTGAMIGLADNTTAAGEWSYYGLEKLGTTAIYYNTTVASPSSNLFRIALDVNRTCFIFGSPCYAVIYDASTATWGNATLVRSGINSTGYIAVLSGTNQVLVVSSDTTTGLQAVTLTTTGNVVTVNTPVSVVLGGDFSSFTQLIPVSTSFVVGYGRATATVAIRAISISGTVPTIGAESALPATSNPALYVSGSVVRTISSLTGSTIYCKPYTVSGSTLTAGTQATANITGSTLRTFLNGNNNIIVQYFNNTHFASVFKLTGTTEAVSSVSLGTGVDGITQFSEYTNVGTTKTIFIIYDNSNATYCNILTDTNGTATSGTQISIAGGGSYFSQVSTVGNLVCFANREGTNLKSITFNTSGASPTLVSVYRAYADGATPYNTDYRGRKSSYNLYISNGVIGLGQSEKCSLITSSFISSIDIGFRSPTISNEIFNTPKIVYLVDPSNTWTTITQIEAAS